MKDEIKEILDNFKIYEDRYKKCNETQFIIFYRDIHLLLDYITNLQHSLWEEQELSELFKDKYEKMKENAEILSKGYSDLEKRNEKAIEYIRNNIADIEFIKKQYNVEIYDDYVETTINDIEKLLNILQGEENEDN